MRSSRGRAAYRQHFLHLGMAVARAAVDSLEAVIAADHHQRPRRPHNHAGALNGWRFGGSSASVRMQQQRIGANVRENNRIPLLQRFQRQRKVGRRRVGGHIGNGIGTVGERGQKVRCAGVPVAVANWSKPLTCVDVLVRGLTDQ